MPTYEWKNKRTGDTVQVERRISEYDTPPDDTDEWVRVITVPPCVPFERMRERGVFERLPQTSLRRPT